MTTSETIIACLNMNILNAKTAKQREFATAELASYKESLQKRKRPKPQPPSAFSAFLDRLEVD